MADLSSRGQVLFRRAQRLLQLVRWLVPAERRDEWQREWEAECWHYLARRDGAGEPGGAAFARRLSGAAPHAFRLRRNAWGLDQILPDLRYAWRTLLKRPGFALLVSGTLAVGIGANAAMFAVVNAILIRPLPYPEPERLVFMYGAFAKNDRAAMSPPDYLDYRAQNTVLASFAARSLGDDAVLTGDGPPERVAAARISSNFFATLGVAPVYGRLFRPDEEQGGGHDVAIVSWGLWQRRFGGDPRVVGRTVPVNGRPTEIVGILPRRLDHSLEFELWLPLEFGTPATSIRRFHNLRGVGRLAPGVDLAEAQANLDAIARRLEATYPENETWRLRLVPYREVVVGDLGRAITVLLGAVGLVLLIACGNVASLQLARATTRQGEILVRAALGASRMRLVRQLLTESLLLAAAGGALGLGLAAVLVSALEAATGSVLPRMAEIRIDPAVTAFTTAVALLSGVLFGLAPALHTVRRNLTAALVALGRASARTRGRDLLVGAQVAVSTVLLVGAGLLTSSLIEMSRVETGFDARGVLTANVALPRARYPTRADQERFWRALTDRLAAVPGVAVAAAASSLPLLGGSDTNYWLEGQPPATEADRRNAMVVSVSEGYFEALGIPIVEGRAFGPAERAGGPGAIVVSRSLASRLFPGEKVAGRRLVVDFGQPFAGEIVGVAGDVRAFGLTSPAADLLYFSAFQPAGFGIAWVNLVLRAAGDPAALAPAVREAVAELDRDLAVEDVRTMAQVVDRSTSTPRFSAWLLGGFSLAALLLAAVGLYGALAFVVSQRSVEIGVRLALGAGAAGVFGMVVRRGLLVVGAGLATGLLAARMASPLLAAQLFRVTPTDPLVYGLAAGVLAGAGLLASVIPARRASRMNPLAALRSP